MDDKKITRRAEKITDCFRTKESPFGTSSARVSSSCLAVAGSPSTYQSTTAGWRRGRDKRPVQERHCRRVNLPSAALNSPAGCLSAPCQPSADPCRLRTPSASATGRCRSRRTTTSAAASAEGTGAGLQERHSVYSFIYLLLYPGWKQQWHEE